MADNLWTPAEVSERFREASLTLKKLPRPQAQGYFSVWPIIKSSQLEMARQDGNRGRRLASPTAVSRLDEAITWLPWITVEERKLVLQRARGVRWKTICFELGCDRSTAWRKWMAALEKVAASLNLASS